MEPLCQQTKKMVHDLHTKLTRVESILHDTERAVIAETEVQSVIDQVSANCDRLNMIAAKEPPSHRASAKLEVNQLRYDIQHIQVALRQLQNKRFQLEREEQEREALLHTDFKPSNESTSIFMGHHVEEHNRLNTVNRRMEEILSSGADILHNLKDQGSTMRLAHKKLHDVLNTLGLSNTVMRLIERRSSQDKAIFWILVLITCLIMFCIWRFYT